MLYTTHSAPQTPYCNGLGLRFGDTPGFSLKPYIFWIKILDECMALGQITNLCM